jgi:hypothetical protein
MYYWLLATVTRCYRTKLPMHCGHFMMYCASPSEFTPSQIHQSEFADNYQQTHLVAKQTETWRGISVNILTNSRVLFQNGSLLHSKFNTQPLITISNSSRILTHVQLLLVL